jgi:hypothetical protein
MLDHLLPFLSRDYELLDESNKENLGFIMRQRARTDLSADASAARHESSELSARRRPLDNISPIGASKVFSRKLAPAAQKRALKSSKKPSKKPSDGAKKTAVKTVGRKRKPLEDITHLYVNERARQPRTSRLSTSVAMRFF